MEAVRPRPAVQARRPSSIEKEVTSDFALYPP
jgi:hypothetical protein